MVLEFGILNSALFPSSNADGVGFGSEQIVWNDVGIGIVPIGAVVAWLKNYTSTPGLLPSFVECNGQVLADAESPYDGQTIPNLNASGGGAQRFLRGATASGATGGTDAHTHSIATKDSNTLAGGTVMSQAVVTGSSGTLPSYYQIVWIMRIK